MKEKEFLLPNKKIVKITYELVTGERFFITGDALEIFESNVKEANELASSHNVKFKEVLWKKIVHTT